MHAREDIPRSRTVLAGEDQGSVVHRSIYGWLEALFDGWNFTINVDLAGQDGLQVAVDHYQGLSERLGYTVSPPEGKINTLGYFYLRQEDPNRAVRTFEYNVKHFPKSANVYDSLGDGLKADGNLKKALRNYPNAVKLGRNTARRSWSPAAAMCRRPRPPWRRSSLAAAPL